MYKFLLYKYAVITSGHNDERTIVKNSKTVLIDNNPGRTAQTIGIARELGSNIELIHEPSIGVIGNKGDSQCYLGVQRKVEIIHEQLRKRTETGTNQLRMRLVQPEYTVATSDGMRNGTKAVSYTHLRAH